MGTRQRLKSFRVRSEAAWVEGYLFSTEKLAENWQMLDDFEGFQYQRVIADIKLESGEYVKAWTYQINMQAKASHNYK